MGDQPANYLFLADPRRSEAGRAGWRIRSCTMIRKSKHATLLKLEINSRKRGWHPVLMAPAPAMRRTLAIALLVAGVAAASSSAHAQSPTKSTQGAGRANPASQNCIDKGRMVTIEKNGKGEQFGVCTFPDNPQCEERAMTRGACGIDRGTFATETIASALRQRRNLAQCYTRFRNRRGPCYTTTNVFEQAEIECQQADGLESDCPLSGTRAAGRLRRRRQHAAEHLGRAIDLRENGIQNAAVAPCFAPVRKDSHFRAQVSRLNLS